MSAQSELWRGLTSQPRGGGRVLLDVDLEAEPKSKVLDWFVDNQYACDELSDFRGIVGTYWMTNTESTWEDLVEFLNEKKGNPNEYLGLHYPFFEDVVIEIIANTFHMPYDSAKSLWYGVDSNALDGLKFVITGKLNGDTRDGYTNRIKMAGGKVQSKVTRDTDYLVTNTPDSGTSKNRDADLLGVEKITEEQLLKMLG